MGSKGSPKILPGNILDKLASSIPHDPLAKSWIHVTILLEDEHYAGADMTDAFLRRSIPLQSDLSILFYRWRGSNAALSSPLRDVFDKHIS